jgi:predicted amidohydrolase
VPEQLRVAAAQFPCVLGDPEGNAERAAGMVGEAAARGARLVVLPECVNTGYDLDYIEAGAPGAESADGPTAQRLGTVARSHDIAIVVGLLERAGSALHSSALVLDRTGVIGLHRKTIVTATEEQHGLVPGDRAADPVRPADLPFALAPVICFEHGFPELALDLALRGAGLLAITSAIRRGTEHLRELRSRARAQDNGCYVVAANAVGGPFCGASLIIDPLGAALATAPTEGAAVIAEDVDARAVECARSQEPVLRRRRPALWQDASDAPEA